MTAVMTEPQVERDAHRATKPAECMLAVLKPETRRLYAADWATFATWCRTGNQMALPANAATLVAYLHDQARQLGSGTLGTAAGCDL